MFFPYGTMKDNGTILNFVKFSNENIFIWVTFLKDGDCVVFFTFFNIKNTTKKQNNV